MKFHLPSIEREKKKKLPKHEPSNLRTESLRGCSGSLLYEKFFRENPPIINDNAPEWRGESTDIRGENSSIAILNIFWTFLLLCINLHSISWIINPFNRFTAAYERNKNEFKREKEKEIRREGSRLESFKVKK